MTEEKIFPLIVWEQTEEFRKEYEEAQKRFHDISNKLNNRGFECTFLGDLRADEDGYFEVWLNDSHNFYRDNLNEKEAISEALKHGNTGWWSLDDLEQFLKGKGPLFERAMYDMEFRRSKRNPKKWAKLTHKDKEEMSKKRIEYFDNLEKEKWPVVEEEAEMLKQLWLMPNENVGLNKTYSIEVGKRGMIHCFLEVNPFSATRTEQLPWFAAMLNQRGHFAKQQHGFYIEARNINLFGEKGIYIKANSDKIYTEVVWPHQIPEEKLYDLAEGLVSRMR